MSDFNSNENETQPEQKSREQIARESITLNPGKKETFYDCLLAANLPSPDKNLSVEAYTDFPLERKSLEAIVVGYADDEGLFNSTAVVTGHDFGSPNDFAKLLANARLYAAAPDLLEAARALRFWFEDNSQTYENDGETLRPEYVQLCAAITKAEAMQS